MAGDSRAGRSPRRTSSSTCRRCRRARRQRSSGSGVTSSSGPPSRSATSSSRSRPSRIRRRTSSACSRRWTTSSSASRSSSYATLGGTLRSSDFQVTAVLCDDLLLDVEPGDTTGRTFALAFDLGTTTVVANLLDLETGQPLAVRSQLNSSSRSAPTSSPASRRRCSTPTRSTCSSARAPRDARRAREARCARRPGCRAAEVYEVSVAGNETMVQIALGIDPEPLSMAPFTIAASALPPATAADFGVRVHPRAPASHVPGDRRLRRRRHRRRACSRRGSRSTVASASSSTSARTREIVLGSAARALATAAPAGPAFEAAQIRCGMRAAEGAIEGVKIPTARWS